MVGRRWTETAVVVAVSVVWILPGFSYRADISWSSRKISCLLMLLLSLSLASVGGRASQPQKTVDIISVADKNCPPLPIHITSSNITLVTASKARISCLPGHHLFPDGSSDLTCLRFKWMANDLVYKWCRPSCPSSCPPSQCERPGVCLCFGVPCLVFGDVLPGDEVDVEVKGAVILPGGIGGALGTCEEGFEVSRGVSQFVVPFVHGQWVMPKTASGATLACRRANNTTCLAVAGASNKAWECRSHLSCHNKPNIPPGMTLTQLDCKTFILTCRGNRTLKGCDEGKIPVIRCISGSWVNVNWDHDKVLTCEPDCDAPCLNGGICDDEGRCRCPDGFHGHHCQHISCSSLLPRIPNGTVNREEGNAQFGFSGWQMECNPGYRLASGREGRQPLVCSLGEWVVPTENNQEEVRCVRHGEVPCLNGGKLKSRNSFPRLLIRCLPGYAMPGGDMEREVFCNETTGKWVVPNNTRCDVVCKNPCFNGGSCDLMDMCRCAEGFAGESCQEVVFEYFKCSAPLPEVPYGESVDGDPPYIQCYPNHILPSGRTNATLRCYNNRWGLQGESEIITENWNALNCSPICHPSCKPPMVCASPGICLCPFHLEGSRCQYPVAESCDDPPPVPNAFVELHTGFVTCRKGFVVGEFGTVTRWLAQCYYSVWISPYPLADGCRPVCDPECSSNGVCSDINYCLLNTIPLIVLSSSPSRSHNDVLAKCPSGYNFEDGRCKEGYLGSSCQHVSCDLVPLNVLNNVLQKSNNTLVVECLEGLTFPHGERRLTFKCNGEYWIFPSKYNSTSDMHCTRNCEQPCQNGGTCEMLGHCRCLLGFTGHLCESRICNDFLPTIVNGTYSYINDSVLVNCTASTYSYWITCENGTWQGDAASEDAPCPIICPLKCKHGGTCIPPGDCKINHWHPLEMDHMPKMCFPNCEPPCQNDGICLGRNRCLCPRGLMGPTCDKGSLCIAPPEAPPNMELKNISGGVYVATCKKNHTFPSPDISSLTISCEAGVWSKSHVYVCRPLCTRQCQNGGICSDVNVCKCPPGTQGPTCGTLVAGKCRADVKWQNVMVTPINETGGLNITCNPGNTLWPPDHGDNWKLLCVSGEWSEVPVEWNEEFPCVPNCDPPCQGGGKCIAPSQCYCGSGVFMVDCMMKKWCNRWPLITNGLAYRLAPRLTRVACLEGRLTYGGSRNVVLRCFDDYWVTASKTPIIVNDVHCNFTCNPRCKNGGRCVGHNMCACNSGYGGPFCDYPVCGTGPLRVQHGQLNAKSSAGMVFGTVRCNDQYRLASGEQQTSFQCRNGTWYFSGDMSGHKLIECHPLCSPPCVNRGSCVAPGHCLCFGGFTGKYCEMRPTLAVSGLKCKFPFSYGHEMHISCITYNSRIPWCATHVNVFGEPLTIDYCNTTHYLEEVVETISGRTCAFPFKAKGVTFWKCARDERERSWCATHVSGTGDVLQWDFCWLDHGYQRVTVTKNGMMCHIPYMHDGMLHHNCYGDAKDPELWCPTDTLDDFTPLQWGVCRRGDAHLLYSFADNVPFPAKPRLDLLPVPQLALVPRNQLVTPTVHCGVGSKANAGGRKVKRKKNDLIASDGVASDGMAEEEVDE
ncbi:hypothetical protein O3P69_015480 [Scylla paramamosain]|uniref:Uncharacterized protein n=1 Tax=Scylla paramamosain TaxID=85552 RepID=A0AAW0T5K4_SCYPA